MTSRIEYCVRYDVLRSQTVSVIILKNNRVGIMERINVTKKTVVRDYNYFYRGAEASVNYSLFNYLTRW